jgi:hypothetical protein
MRSAHEDALGQKTTPVAGGSWRATRGWSGAAGGRSFRRRWRRWAQIFWVQHLRDLWQRLAIVAQSASETSPTEYTTPVAGSSWRATRGWSGAVFSSKWP